MPARIGAMDKLLAVQLANHGGRELGRQLKMRSQGINGMEFTTRAVDGGKGTGPQITHSVTP